MAVPMMTIETAKTPKIIRFIGARYAAQAVLATRFARSGDRPTKPLSSAAKQNVCANRQDASIDLAVTLILTRFRRHPGWRENASGVVDGTKETKVVHARVQGRGGASGAGRGPQRPRGGAGLGPDGDGAAGWVKSAAIDAGKGPPGALTTAEREELVRLRRDNKRLEMEREILKKAAAFFAKESR